MTDGQFLFTLATIQVKQMHTHSFMPIYTLSGGGEGPRNILFAASCECSLECGWLSTEQSVSQHCPLQS